MTSRAAYDRVHDVTLALITDLEFINLQQRRCGEAIRALATLAQDCSDTSGKAHHAKQRDGIAALFNLIADQMLLLATEADDHLATGRRLL